MLYIKSFILITIFFCLNFNTLSQNISFISNFETLNFIHSNNKDISTFGYNKALNFYSVNYNLGFAYLFKNNIDTKLALGFYRNFSERNLVYSTNYSFIENKTRYLYISNKSSFFNIYVSFGKLYKLKNKILDFSIIAPLMVSYNRFNYVTDTTTKLIELESEANTEYLPNYYTTRVIFNTGVYYKVLPRFYIGINLGTGLQYEFIKGNYTKTTSKNDFVQNIQTTSTQKILKNESIITMPIISNIGIRYFLK